MPKSRGRKRPERRPPAPRPEYDAALGHDEPGEDLQVRLMEDLDGARHAVIVPRSIERLDEEQMHAVKALQRNATQQQMLRQQIDYLVDEARDLGVTWAAIGWSVGTTGEAARQRWGDFDPASEPG